MVFKRIMALCGNVLLLLLASWQIPGCGGWESQEIAKSLAEARQDHDIARSLNQEAMAHSDLAEKRRLLEEALSKDDLYGEAHNNLGVVLYQQGHFYEAAKHLQRASDLLPGSSAPPGNLAVLHMAVQQWERALPFAREAYKRNSRNCTTVRLLAECLVAVGESGDDLQDLLEKLTVLSSDETVRKWAIEKRMIEQDKSLLLK